MTGYGDEVPSCTFECGGVFQLTPAAEGPGTETILYPFPGGSKGIIPESNLLFDSAGNLYGMTEYRGNTFDCKGNGCGVVFESNHRINASLADTAG